MSENDRFRGCLLGLAVGDAVGTTGEFQPRGGFPPLTDMVGGGPHALNPGEWTDDTSMALCLATSLADRGRYDPADQMDRYWRWYREGYLSSTGRCFDIGNTTGASLRRYAKSGDPYSGSADPKAAGNGSIMRLAPVPMFFFPDLEAVEQHSGDSSRTTHAAPECIDACRFLGRVICRALLGTTKEDVLLGDRRDFAGSPRIVEIARGEYLEKNECQISGDGYVAHSLEAALWCFHHATTFGEAILAAANLGEDADTTAAVCGQVAGAFYGVREIPRRWTEQLVLGREIAELADRLHYLQQTREAVAPR
ncbi:MAG: ADP-ribosylglycohydrolase family protein [Candidatus Eisenbacteria bacterium]|nr:ADP-ribosylglycohydrolase family protein [Candidatus Eisenbacteria bacterium]